MTRISYINGYDSNGFNSDFIHRNGTKYDNYGYDIRGFNNSKTHKNGTKYDNYGYDYNGVNIDGYNVEGMNKYGLIAEKHNILSKYPNSIYKYFIFKIRLKFEHKVGGSYSDQDVINGSYRYYANKVANRKRW